MKIVKTISLTFFHYILFFDFFLTSLALVTVSKLDPDLATRTSRLCLEILSLFSTFVQVIIGREFEALGDLSDLFKELDVS